MTDDHWATVELTDADREALEDGAVIQRLIESDGRWVDALEVRWQTMGALSRDANAARREWPELFEAPPARIGEKPVDEVYEDRNLLACALAQLAPFGAWTAGEQEDGEWAIVYIETPFGQVSWHVPREMAEGLNLPRDDDYEWDGHDRERKNDVLATWTKSVVGR